jgi:pimeloyl-ACP methyl ester carboxylesterase
MQPMTTFVLVPGMWLGGWAWRAVTARLRTAGHEAYPVTLTGLGERAHLAIPAVDLTTHITDVVNLLQYEQVVDAVLVGHSYAGVPVRGVADRVPERIARVVYLDSGPLPDGMAQFDTNPPEARPLIRAQVGDGFLLPPPTWDPAEDPVNLAGLDADALALLRRLSVGHPFGSATEPLRLERPEQPPSTLLTCTFPEEHVRAMLAAGHPFFAGVQRDNLDIRSLPTGHWPMLSEPAALAELLIDIGRA